MKKMLSVFMLFCFAVVMAGCSKTTAISSPVSFQVKPGTTIAQVEKAILDATKELEWKTSKLSNGLIEAKHSARGHNVTIHIKYNKNGYDISYKDSANLNYDPTKNTIHKNYNRWINNLNTKIMSNLY